MVLDLDALSYILKYMVKEKGANREYSRKRTKRRINSALRTLFLGSLLFLPSCATNSNENPMIVNGTPVATFMPPGKLTELSNNNVAATATAMPQNEKDNLLEIIPRSISEATGFMIIRNNDGTVSKSTVTLLDIDNDGVVYLLTTLHSIKDGSGTIQKPLNFEISQSHEGGSEDSTIFIVALGNQVTYSFLGDHAVVSYLPDLKNRSAILGQFNEKMTPLGLDKAKTEFSENDLTGSLYGIGYPNILNGKPVAFVNNNLRLVWDSSSSATQQRLFLDNIIASQGASGTLMINEYGIPIGMLVAAKEAGAVLELTPDLALLVKTAKEALPK